MAPLKFDRICFSCLLFKIDLNAVKISVSHLAREPP